MPFLIILLTLISYDLGGCLTREVTHLTKESSMEEAWAKQQNKAKTFDFVVCLWHRLHWSDPPHIWFEWYYHHHSNNVFDPFKSFYSHVCSSTFPSIIPRRRWPKDIKGQHFSSTFQVTYIYDCCNWPHFYSRWLHMFFGTVIMFEDISENLKTVDGENQFEDTCLFFQFFQF